MRRRFAARPQRASGRALLVALGVLWLVDGALQLEPSHFDPSFFGAMLRMNMAEPPAWLWDLSTAIEPAVVSHAALANALASAIQLLIGLGLLFRRTTKLALAASIPWALCVWLFGEAAGGLFGPGASALIGAPGAALIYAVVAVVLWPDAESERSWLGPTARSVVADVLWVALWLGTAALESEALNRLPLTPSSEIMAAGTGEPGILSGLDHAVGSLVSVHGIAFAALAGAVQAAIGLGICSGRTRRLALWAGLVLGLFYGIVGQDLGGVFSAGLAGVAVSGATDPGTGPIIVLFALAVLRRPPPDAESARSVSLVGGPPGDEAQRLSA